MLTIRKAENSDRTEWLRMRKSWWPECAADRHAFEMDLVISSFCIGPQNIIFANALFAFGVHDAKR